MKMGKSKDNTKKIVNLIYFRLKKLLSHFLDFPCTQGRQGPTHKQKE